MLEFHASKAKTNAMALHQDQKRVSSRPTVESQLVERSRHSFPPIKRIEKDSFFSFFGRRKGLQDSVHMSRANRRASGYGERRRATLGMG
jgi:hypothetical protein